MGPVDTRLTSNVKGDHLRKERLTFTEVSTVTRFHLADTSTQCWTCIVCRRTILTREAPGAASLTEVSLVRASHNP